MCVHEDLESEHASVIRHSERLSWDRVCVVLIASTTWSTAVLAYLLCVGFVGKLEVHPVAVRDLLAYDWTTLLKLLHHVGRDCRDSVGECEGANVESMSILLVSLRTMSYHFTLQRQRTHGQQCRE